MADIEKTVYRLYAMPLNAQSIANAAQERFSRATPTPEPGYVLIYTAGSAPEMSQEITKENINRLSPADERWLFDSNAALIAEEIRRREPEILSGLSEKIEALEKELERKKKEFEEKEG